jgi:hypothetical protein
MNPNLSLEYSTAVRQELLAESTQLNSHRQVARLIRAARRAERARLRAGLAEQRLRHAIAVGPAARLDARG